MEYKFISNDCMEDVYLHDCSVTGFCIEETALILAFDFIIILKTHPLNPYGVSKCTGEARIQFNDYSVFSPYYMDNDNCARLPVELNQLLIKFEVLREEHVIEADGYYRYTFFGDWWHDKTADFAGFQIRCKNIVVNWNELDETAWFEK